MAAAAAMAAVSSGGLDLKTATVLGKPALSTMLGSKALPQLDWHKTSDINWTDFNYPPVLRLIHYDVQELPAALRGPVRLLNIVFVITVMACWLNLLTTLVVLPWTNGMAHGRWLLQTIIHLTLLPSASLWTFYLGYRGLAEPDPQLVKNFQIAQLGLSVIYFVFSVFPFGCVNGIFRLRDVGGSSDAAAVVVYWAVATIVEAGLWGLAFTLGLVSFFRVRRKVAEGQDTRAAEKV